MLDLTPDETEYMLRLGHRMGAGERSCLAVAASRGALLATDDGIARQYARRAGIPVIGSVGILIRNIQVSDLSLNKAQVLLETMIWGGHRPPIRRLGPFFPEKTPPAGPGSAPP